MEERLKSLMQDLGNAINESLSDSERIAEAIGEIKRAGYDVFLVLEATIGFNKRDASTADASDDETTDEEQEVADDGQSPFYDPGSKVSEGTSHCSRRRKLLTTQASENQDEGV